MNWRCACVLLVAVGFSGLSRSSNGQGDVQSAGAPGSTMRSLTEIQMVATQAVQASTNLSATLAEADWAAYAALQVSLGEQVVVALNGLTNLGAQVTVMLDWTPITNALCGCGAWVDVVAIRDNLVLMTNVLAALNGIDTLDHYPVSFTNLITEMQKTAEATGVLYGSVSNAMVSVEARGVSLQALRARAEANRELLRALMQAP